MVPVPALRHAIDTRSDQRGLEHRPIEGVAVLMPGTRRVREDPGRRQTGRQLSEYAEQLGIDLAYN